MNNINDVLGHFVEAEVSVKGWSGKNKTVLTGRIIYSSYNASLFFKPKNSKNRGYIIENEDDIHSVKITRKDNKSNKYYSEEYDNRDQFEQQFNERQEREQMEREKRVQLRKERFEMDRKKDQEKKKEEVIQAKLLGGYEELEKEVIDFYESSNIEFFNESFVRTTVVPLLNKLIHKSINNVNEYPKHYFDKKRNSKFCTVMENKLGIKLTNTQKGNVEKINKYLIA